MLKTVFQVLCLTLFTTCFVHNYASAQQSNPPKDNGQSSFEYQSGTQEEYDTAMQEGLSAGGCRVWCQRVQTLAPVFYCGFSSIFNCSCPQGTGLFIIWREWGHIFTSLPCSDFSQGTVFNFSGYPTC